MRRLIRIMLAGLTAGLLVWAVPAQADDGPSANPPSPQLVVAKQGCPTIPVYTDGTWKTGMLTYTLSTPNAISSSASDSSPVGGGWMYFDLSQGGAALGSGTFTVNGSLQLTNDKGVSVTVTLEPLPINCGTLPELTGPSGPSDGSNGPPPGFDPSSIPNFPGFPPGSIPGGMPGGLSPDSRAGFCDANGTFINLLWWQGTGDPAYAELHLRPADVDVDGSATGTKGAIYCAPQASVPTQSAPSMSGPPPAEPTSGTSSAGPTTIINNTKVVVIPVPAGCRYVAAKNQVGKVVCPKKQAPKPARRTSSKRP